MEKRCLNCNNIVTDTYCGKCGQSIHTSRVGSGHLVEELQYGLLHINKGLIYTVREMLLRPAVVIKNYLSGKRAKYTKPFLFLIIWGVLYSLVFHSFHFFPMIEMNHPDAVLLEYIPLYKWYFDHYSLAMLLIIPFFAGTTYLVFRKRKYNYIEHLVIFSYINGTKIAFLLMSFPLIYFTRSIAIYHIVHILVNVYMIWALSVLFRKRSFFASLAKVILSLLLAFAIIVILITATFEILKYCNIKL